MRNRLTRILLIGGAVLLLGIVLYNLPPVHSRLAWRLDNLRSSIKYFLNPPDQAVFVPGQQAAQFTATPVASATATATLAGPTSTACPNYSPDDHAHTGPGARSHCPV